MAITQFIVVPSRATGQDTFSEDAEVFWGQLPTFVTEVNSFITSLNGSWTSSSVTSLLVGTGSKTLTVGTGLGFQVGMPIRLAFSDTVYMTGDVASYNSVTGELICNITSSTGSGTYALWSVYAIPASVGATLVANKFTGLQTFADEVAVASASTINITTADSNNIEITGTTTITAVTMPEGAVIKARASGAFQLTNSSSLIVQGGSNYTTTVNDILTFTKDGAGNVHVEISKINENSISQLNSSITITDAGTGKIETTIDGIITEELKTASRKSTIDGGSTLYPEFKCRAWVNFNGTGTIAIRASGNVSSITDNGVGDYTVNFTSAMPDGNYSVTGISQTSNVGSNTDGFNIKFGVAPTASSVQIVNFANGVGFSDSSNICVSIFR